VPSNLRDASVTEAQKIEPLVAPDFPVFRRENVRPYFQKRFDVYNNQPQEICDSYRRNVFVLDPIEIPGANK
jgi:hypothetical protein